MNRELTIRSDFEGSLPFVETMHLVITDTELQHFDGSRGELSAKSASLTTLVLSNNKLITAIHLHRLINLVSLDISKNRLVTLSALPCGLKCINASDNRLRDCAALAACMALEDINVSGNFIEALPILPQSVRNLNAANNELTGLDALPVRLRLLDVRHNRISDFTSFSHTGLQVLWTHGNPGLLGSVPKLDSFPQLRKLNGGVVSQRVPVRVGLKSQGSMQKIQKPCLEVMSINERSLMLRLRTLAEAVQQEDQRAAALTRELRLHRNSLAQLSATHAELTAGIQFVGSKIDEHHIVLEQLSAMRTSARRDFEDEHSQLQRSRITSAIFS